MLHAKTIGEGPTTVVGLHGWNGTVDTFDPIAPYLPDDTALLAIDLPGYGASPPPDTWSLPAIGRQILHTLDAHGIDDFSLLCSCSGAFPGFFLARHAGADRLQSFVWLEPFAFIPWYLRLFLTPAIGWPIYRLTFGTALGRGITNWFLDDDPGDSTGAQSNMLASFERSPIDVPHRYLDLFDELPEADAFADVPGRKLLAYGDATFAAVRQSVRRWQTVWPDAKPIELPGAGHLPLEASPAAVAGLLSSD